MRWKREGGKNKQNEYRFKLAQRFGEYLKGQGESTEKFDVLKTAIWSGDLIINVVC